jgi:CheY-like chemotaxis protein
LGEIFMEYFRLAATRDTVEGLGIGLTIVRRAMKLLEYGISVRSQLGVGSTFKLKVPLNRVSRDSVPALGTLDTNPADLDFNSTYTVLVLENDAVANDAMVRVMSDWGYRVMAATSGERLLRDLQEGSQGIVDLIVSDLRLGEAHDGLEYIGKVRDLLASPRLPAILLTGDLGREIQTQAAAMGVRVLYKPLRPPQLRIALRNALVGRS